MRISIAIFLISISLTLHSQEYQTLQLEKRTKDPDTDNKIFTPGKGFLYRLSIYESENEKQLIFTNPDWILQDSPVDSSEEQVNRVLYITTPVKKSKRTNKGQTEVIIAYEPNGKVYQNTGIVENSQNIWLHPPRSRFFKILELCPFPYIKFTSINSKWKDQIVINQKWQDERWATWDDELKIDLYYQNIGYEDIETKQGIVNCTVTKSTANSIVGTTSLITHFNSELGFVKLEYEILNKYRVVFKLLKTLELVEVRSVEDYIMKKGR